MSFPYLKPVTEPVHHNAVVVTHVAEEVGSDVLKWVLGDHTGGMGGISLCDGACRLHDEQD